MYKLLIVDDELYAVQAVQTGIDWAAHGFTEVLCAYDADEAMGILLQQPVDVMICDIEMPGLSGVELLEWVNENSPGTVTVFLTGHADFTYAQQAVHLGGFDFLLKPVKYEQLQAVVDSALRQVENTREARRFGEMYRTYAKLHETQKPLLTELFWQDILSKRVRPDPDQIGNLIATYQVALDPHSHVLPVMVSVEHWEQEFTERDEEILEYALRNAASEMIIAEPLEGEVITDRAGIIFVLLYLPDNGPSSLKELEDSCRRYVEAGARYFYCSLSCYIGTAASIPELTNVYHRLIEMEHANVTATGKIFLLQELKEKVPFPRKMSSFTFDAAEWLHLLEHGRAEEVIGQIEGAVRSEKDGGITPENLYALYHALLGFVYQTAHQKGASVNQIIGGSKAMDPSAATRSVSQFLVWARKLLTNAAEFIQRNRKESSALMDKIKSYVESHLKSVTREEIAATVYLNSAYLSRLFKKETGVSLMDYIISMKMNRAKMMLTESNIKITDIIDGLGYENMSHFSKMFKKQVGITPQEYRKRYQAIGK